MGDAPAEVVTRHTSRLESARASSAEKEVCDELPARYLSDPRSARLVKLGVAIGALAEAVRSHARRALAENMTPTKSAMSVCSPSRQSASRTRWQGWGGSTRRSRATAEAPRLGTRSTTRSG